MIPTSTARINGVVNEIKWLGDLGTTATDDTHSPIHTHESMSVQNTTAREGDVIGEDDFPATATDDDVSDITGLENEGDAIMAPIALEGEESLRRSGRTQNATHKITGDESKHLQQLRTAVGLVAGLVAIAKRPYRSYEKLKKRVRGKSKNMQNV